MGPTNNAIAKIRRMGQNGINNRWRMMRQNSVVDQRKGQKKNKNISAQKGMPIKTIPPPTGSTDPTI